MISLAQLFTADSTVEAAGTKIHVERHKRTSTKQI
jgi:hypothetical protein